MTTRTVPSKSTGRRRESRSETRDPRVRTLVGRIGSLLAALVAAPILLIVWAQSRSRIEYLDEPFTERRNRRSTSKALSEETALHEALIADGVIAPLSAYDTSSHLTEEVVVRNRAMEAHAIRVVDEFPDL